MAATPQFDRVIQSAAIAVPRQTRGKCLMRRKYQTGYVFQKGRRKSDEWLPDVAAYVQFWRDIPGRPDAKRDVVSIGICRTRTIAERRAAERLEQLGINSAQTFIESTCSTTFKEQGEMWLKSLSNRKRNPLEQTTIDNRQYALDKWIYPFFDGRLLADISNRAMKEFVEHISKLAPATIRDYTNIVKGVVASAINEDGEELFPRKWNEEYIDAPLIDGQRQPSATSEGVKAIVAEAKGQYQMLYALLAGCGPLRVGEALGLSIPQISEDFRTLTVNQKAKAGEIQPYLKTKNGVREIDLCTSLANMLHEFVGTRTSGLVFHSEPGNQLLQSNILRRNFHPILAELKHIKGGFNIFRRFRITHLEKSDCPAALKHFWSGHAQAHVSERYVKLLTDRDYRLEWAERVGTGFVLPVGQPGLLRLVRKSA
jgi:integrase